MKFTDSLPRFKTTDDRFGEAVACYANFSSRSHNSEFRIPNCADGQVKFTDSLPRFKTTDDRFGEAVACYANFSSRSHNSEFRIPNSEFRIWSRPSSLLYPKKGAPVCAFS